VQRLGLTMRGVGEVRVSRPEIASKFCRAPRGDEYPGGRLQHAVFGIEALDGCSAARRITLAEDLLKIPLEQFPDVVGHQRHAA